MSKIKTSAQKEAKALARAEYKAEGKRREYIRKAERKQKQKENAKYKKRGPFCKCGCSSGEMHTCPFEEEMSYSPSGNLCNCCSECRHDCAMSI